MYNLGTVFNFEFIRTIKKKTFWIMTLLFPIIIGLIFAIVYFSNQETNKAVENTKNQKFSIEITDESGLINKDLVKQFGASQSADKQTAIDKVQNGELDAYFYYPKDLDKKNIEVYAKDVGLFDNSRYQAVAKVLLQQSVTPSVDAQITAILQDRVQFSSVTYKNGKQFDGFRELIAPGIFLLLFYILIAMFGNQMLTSTTEEKENRVTEMILTTIEARTLIIGKIFSLIALAFVQIIAIIVPILIAYIFFRNQLALPDLDLSNIPLDPLRIAIGASIFIFSFLFFTGLLVAIGAIAPTAKEAGGFFAIVMLFIFGPLYAVTLFISMPDSPLVRFLSFFPLTAPIPLMLRNAVGNLAITDSLIGIAILAISSIISLSIAVRLFRYGILEYSNRIPFSVIFNKKTKNNLSN
ncbi:MAG TPA: ABC transporter permease [Candidatus Angelobacter sp.]|nr:ABC transporter permease [Candidatus Angelobacter sp.]